MMFGITAVGILTLSIMILGTMTITIILLGMITLSKPTHSVTIMTHTKRHPALPCSE
jgi:hypothetical protein